MNLPAQLHTSTLSMELEYHYIDEQTDEQFDDLTVEDLISKSASGTTFTSDTLFWEENLSDLDSSWRSS